MNKLPKIFVGVVWVYFSFFFPEDAFAVTIASQDQAFESQLNIWQTLQELGTNLSGTAQSFTFRVSTSKPNLDQFDYTATNTRIYDKSDNSYIVGCVSQSSDPNNPLRGLTFNTTNVPPGYQDVTIDFSCRNYNFIPEHRYLIIITNANMGNYGSGNILFAAAAYTNAGSDLFTGGGVRYGNGNTYDYSNNSGSCDPAAYRWYGTDPWHNGCYVWGIAQNDLYFVLSNNAPPPLPPRLPVVFIPGIGGSEMKASQDIIWSKDDGHGGTYSHAYATQEKVWVNQDEAVKLGDDDYFDVLKLKTDGVTSEAALSLTGNLTSFGYGDIDSFFTGMGYVKGTNFFVFPYDWRKDIRSNKDSLDSLIEQAKTSSGQPKVNLVVHSMGGLVARFYISDSTKASKVNKLIELGVPHLGAASGMRTLMYGSAMQKNVFGVFPVGIPAKEVKDASQNSPALFQLLPSIQYFNFYNNSDNDRPYPFRDDRDIDNNKIAGVLNYDQTKTLLSNLSYNMTAFGLGEQFHNPLDQANQTNGTKIYNIVGSSQPTLGQIQETWWITWPINLIPKTDEIYINGDDTVPLYSASLKNDTLDISGASKIYYVEQKHGDLVTTNGTAMQTVKSILNDDNFLPTEVKDQKITLEGQQVSLDDGELNLYDDQNRHCGLNDKGEIEENIPEVTCTTSGNTKHAFVKKKSAKVKVTATRKNPTTNSKTTNLKTRVYKQDKISKTTIYKDISIPPTGKVEFTLDPAVDTTPTLAYYPGSTKTDNTKIESTSEATGSAALDQTPPTTNIQISGTKDSSGVYTGPVTVTLTGNDNNSGISKIEYSLDNGVTVQTYTSPFTISTPGKTTIQFKSIDKSGNEEIPQTITIEITPAPTPTPTPVPITTSSTSGSSSSDNSTSTTNTGSSETNNSTSAATTSSVVTTIVNVIPNVSEESHDSISSSPAILGISFTNPSHISDEINVHHLLEKNENLIPSKITEPSVKQTLGGLLIVSASLGALASMGLGLTFMPLKALSAVKTLPSLKPLSFSGKTSFVKPFPK